MKTQIDALRGCVRASHIPGTMNAYEQDYEEHVLKPALASGQIRAYYFEAVKLVLADNTTYLPDFLVVRSDFALEVHEVKGHWEEDARVKFKVAAARFPFVFRAFTQPTPGTWQEETFTKTAPTLSHEETVSVATSSAVMDLTVQQLRDIARVVIELYQGDNHLTGFILRRAGVSIEKNPFL